MDSVKRDELIRDGSVVGSEANLTLFRLNPMEAMGMLMNPNLVAVAVRGDGCVGYFEPTTPTPDGWRTTGQQDISGIMESNRLDKSQALSMMNQHWSQYR